MMKIMESNLDFEEKDLDIRKAQKNKVIFNNTNHNNVITFPNRILRGLTFVCKFNIPRNVPECMWIC